VVAIFIKLIKVSRRSEYFLTGVTEHGE